MAKWADYLISAVKYDKEHKHIEEVKAHEDKEDSIGAAKIYSRMEIVNAIGRGVTFVTIYKNDKGSWNKGQKVFVVTINSKKYIKTVENNREEDNLENLPEF
ncbi:MAG: DUF3892 domain-containing protein [Ignavibacteriales bacterium]|nr:DUF3892 domain-containing protein [Ignavibacteriota bacterium]MCB9250810.1 DUF3892 domain-containing protein [Ignavibacteriales bacterium]